MSYSVDQIINQILEGKAKPRRCVQDPYGICFKTVKIEHRAMQCDSC